MFVHFFYVHFVFFDNYPLLFYFFCANISSGDHFRRFSYINLFITSMNIQTHRADFGQKGMVSMDNPSFRTPTKVIMVTSSKGGVGKTTAVANLSMALALMGKRILAVDLDMGNRCLDLALGLENQALYDISDVLRGSVQPESAAVEHPRCTFLRFVAAPPQPVSLLTPETFSAMIRSYAAGNYDFILIDTPGGTDAALVCAADSADAALIVSTEQAASIRSAERTGRYLQELGVANRRLVVNCFSGGLKKSEKRLVRLLQVIDTVSIPLIGVVPFERNVWFSKTGEQLLDQSPLKNTAFAGAFRNIAARVVGRHVAVLDRAKF